MPLPSEGAIAKSYTGKTRCAMEGAIKEGNNRSDLVQVRLPVTEKVVIRGQGFVARLRGINVEDRLFFLIARGTVEHAALWGDDLAPADIGQPVLSAPRLEPDPVGRDAEHVILQAAGHHRVRTVRQHQIRGMAQDVGALDSQRPCRFWVEPVEADHDPDVRRTDVPDPEAGVARGEKQRLFIEQVRLAVQAEKPRRSYQDRRVVAAVRVALRQTGHQVHTAGSREPEGPPRGGA